MFDCSIEKFGVITDSGAILIIRGHQLIAKNKVTPICDHQWVNVGFSSIKMVCKKCDAEKS
jgi:hypothetical protein